MKLLKLHLIVILNVESCIRRFTLAQLSVSFRTLLDK